MKSRHLESIIHFPIHVIVIYSRWCVAACRLRGRRKHLWFSVSKDLYHDARRDLRDIKAGDIPTCLLKDSVDLDDFEVGRTREHLLP